MFPFVSNIFRSDLPLFIFDDIFVPGPGIRVGVPRPPYTNQQFRDQVPKPPNLQKMQSVKKSLADYSETQGQYWCILGDMSFEKGDYTKAIQFYDRAIELTDSTESSFFRSRGLAYKKIGNLEQAYKDAIMAIELDDRNIKAHLLCGQVLAERGKSQDNTHEIETAINRLTKARTLCAGQKKQYYEDELSKYIYRAKKLLWYKNKELEDQKKRQAIQNYSNYLQQRIDLNEEQRKKEIDAFINSIGNPDQKQNYDIPSYLICKITFEIMENPVVTDAGHTYERDMLIEAIQKNGPVDPCTRQPISGEFYPNHNIKQATQDFLLNNPWAFEYQSGENYADIEF
ncbi:unnamed protein product [Paramecium pentaurelia]|uniref:RING-type E3 ubiquitin transferase n=1 Tax=Paramecium pentaurelia TaxID=43138 RepID=A0A8S1X841_9CILI|nr:unnamed protein product [Paramecium pentaurelia]